MKKFVHIILVVAFAIFAIADTVYDFVANDTVHYFSEQPHRLLLVTAIGIAGGLLTLCFFLSSPRLQRKAKLATLGSGASFVMLSGGYFAFRLADLPPELDSAIPRHMPWILLLCSISIAGVLWLEFYQALRGRDRVA